MSNRTMGIYTACKAISIYIQGIDFVEDKVLASANGLDPKWYPMTEKDNENTGETENGFLFEGVFIPFSANITNLKIL